MCPFEVWLQSGSVQCAGHNRADGTGVAKTSVRRPTADENVACHAVSWAMLVQVDRDGFSHIGRKRKAVVKASLASDRQHTGPPVDVIKFQGDDFTCSQSQAGQEKNEMRDRDNPRECCEPGLDDSFDVLRLKVPRHFSKSPSRDARDSPSQITLGLPTVEEEPKERAEGAVTISCTVAGLPERA